MTASPAKQMTWHAWVWNPWVEEMMMLGRSVAVLCDADCEDIRAESMPMEVAG